MKTFCIQDDPQSLRIVDLSQAPKPVLRRALEARIDGRLVKLKPGLWMRFRRLWNGV